MGFHSFNVRPRYTGGSPGAFFNSPQTTFRVAQQEVEAREHALEGIFGDEQKQRAERLGVEAIAYALYEERGGWKVMDMLTGETYLRPAEHKLRRQKWLPWDELPEWAQVEFVDRKPSDDAREPTTLRGGVFEGLFKVNTKWHMGLPREQALVGWKPEKVEQDDYWLKQVHEA